VRRASDCDCSSSPACRTTRLIFLIIIYRKSLQLTQLTRSPPDTRTKLNNHHHPPAIIKSSDSSLPSVSMSTMEVKDHHGEVSSKNGYSKDHHHHSTTTTSSSSHHHSSSSSSSHKKHKKEHKKHKSHKHERVIYLCIFNQWQFINDSCNSPGPRPRPWREQQQQGPLPQEAQALQRRQQ
jgi:hypothetical protein